ncbi:MAG: SURF1 family protein [Proteobacteria bacterium]|nr:SURF1 family protein [Pseudomonadota bacterium]HQR03901.1 SURF1 family protein [Rhodocyclaceae bacterium]
MRRSTLFAGLLLIAVIGTCVAAGGWQLHRAAYKEALQARAHAVAEEAPVSITQGVASVEALEFHRVEASGFWAAEKTILIDNKISDGVVGYQVVTPLKLDGAGGYVLVNRGWIAAPRLRSELPTIITPEGRVTITGTASQGNGHFIELSSNAIQGRVWENLTVERFAQWSGLHLEPLIVYQQGGAADGLRRTEAISGEGYMTAARHRGYAITWFSLAAVFLILGIYAGFKSSGTHEQND